MYFFMDEGSSKCFLEDLALKQVVYVSYKCPVCDPKMRTELAKHTKVTEKQNNSSRLVQNTPLEFLLTSSILKVKETFKIKL
jgi:hypothetical protein